MLQRDAACICVTFLTFLDRAKFIWTRSSRHPRQSTRDAASTFSIAAVPSNGRPTASTIAHRIVSRAENPASTPPPAPPRSTCVAFFSLPPSFRIAQPNQLTNEIPSKQPSYPSPPTLIVHGPEDTGKTLILRALLDHSDARFAWVSAGECISAREAVGRIAQEVGDALGLGEALAGGAAAAAGDVGALAGGLKGALRGVDKFLLVLDGADGLGGEMGGMFLAGVARLGEGVPGLSVVLVVRGVRVGQLRIGEVPCVRFGAYGKEEMVGILKGECPGLPAEGGDEGDEEEGGEPSEEVVALWTAFLGFVYDTLAAATARTLTRFLAAALKLWPRFVRPVVQGRMSATNISGLYLASKAAFADETLVIDTAVEDYTPPSSVETAAQDLPTTSKYLLIAAYLASFSPAKHDHVLFTTHHAARRKKRGGLAKSGLSRAKKAKIPRRLLAPSPFPLERLLAIYAALRGPDRDGAGVGAEVLAQWATLGRLGLVRAARGAGGDVLEGGGRWRVGVGWEFVRRVGRGVGVEVGDWLGE